MALRCRAETVAPMAAAQQGGTGETRMEDASIFIAEILLSFAPNPELYPLSGFDLLTVL